MLALLFLSSCTKDAAYSETSSNREFKVETLFEYDGCKVYRFVDASTKYFTNCKGSTQWTETCGKSCNRNIEIKGR
jgi:hypothetical protein